MLRENCTLLHLHLYNCKIGDEEAEHLSDMLRENCSLLYLHLWDNEIGPEGARNLSDALRENSTLLYLDIGGNEIGPEGARHLSDMLRENSTLLYLDIAGNNINNKQLEDQINNEIQSRTSSSDSKPRSFDECRAFLQEYLNQIKSSSGSSSSPSTSVRTIPSSSTTNTITSTSSSSSSTTTSSSASSSSASICLESTIQEFLDYCAGLKKWPEKIVQSLSSTLLEEECVFTVEMLLETWTNSVAALKTIKIHLIKQMRDVLISIFPASEFSPSYPAFYAWNPNAATLSSPTASQPPVHPSHPEQRFSGVKVGVYTIHSEIHRGHENIVFRVLHELTQASLALKLYSSVESRNRERDMLGALPSHSRIVLLKSSLDVSSSELKALSLDDSFSPACVFEFGESSLLDAYQSDSVHDQETPKRWIEDAAKALLFVHENGLVHLDIKPSNYMIFREGPIVRLKLIDFDCCRRRGERISKQEYAPGTPMFAPPEVLYHNQKQDDDLLLDSSLDVYSFGAFAYYLLSGTPFPVDVARICLQKGLSKDASMSAVWDVMLHPKRKEEEVLNVVTEEKRISEQQASMLKRCLVDRVPMSQVVRHPFFGVQFSATHIRDMEAKANVGALIQGVGQQLDHHGAMLEDLSLSSSSTSISFLSTG